MEKKHTIKDFVLALKKKKFIVVFLLGMSAGLPLMLVASSLKVWLRREEIDLTTVSFISWLMIPYSLNFCWAPILDNFFVKKFGRRRTWIFIGQAGIATSLILVSLFNPENSLTLLVLSGLGVSIFSATQDISIDAYRREIMDDEEQGVGSALYVYGYRVAMLFASGFGLWIVDADTWGWSFNQMFLLMGLAAAALMLVTFWADEPDALISTEKKTFSSMVILPFKEFLTRKMAFTILFFIFFFKFGDGVASSLYSTFYVDLGYSNKIIAEVTKGIGFISSMLGLAVGASLIYILGVFRSLILFGLFQALSTAFFAILPTLGTSWWGLAAVVSFEDFSSGLGTTALVAFMSVMADKRFTATQYALLASLSALGRTFFSGFAGKIIEYSKTMFTSLSAESQLLASYQVFFITCAVIALPGLLLAWKINKNEKVINEHFDV